ncbi:transcriptional regulator [Seonamhaeicola sp. S2-3]|uniref:GntR family transcriptional regulator n=1 Tax=Seonamhaeicola sp. S2-3 TaxID=1936081 RepID=UPI0009729A77|nr:GntR family transcriptional regulator [Seonamhaeicola sp. S2-3]APY11853.1 transcriptional regulator [Seonamhaeicola sp. S2-3]
MKKIIDETKYIDINKNFRVPMYQQIVDSIINNISNGNIELNEKLPSINAISKRCYLSRDTVERAYRILKERNIIVSIPRRGYYVSKPETLHKSKILFLVDKLSSYKMKVYNSFLDRIGLNSKIDLVVYHCDESFFLNTLRNNKSGYDFYIIVPHFKIDNLHHASYTEEVVQAIDAIPKNKLMILDNLMPSMGNDVAAVYQEFDKDIYEALNDGMAKISKYKKMVLIYPENSVYPFPRRILHGFRKFCLENEIDYEILNELCDGMSFKKGDLFIIMEESDLVDLVNQIREKRFKIGEEIGVVSYNDTLLKQLLGIAVVSTDFKIMGEMAAQMLLKRQTNRVKVPFSFIDRPSV